MPKCKLYELSEDGLCSMNPHNLSDCAGDECDHYVADDNISQPEFSIRAFSHDEDERFYSGGDNYKQSCIGHLRQDFGGEGDEFWYTWWPNHEDMNTPEFKTFFNRYVDWLRFDNCILKDLRSMEPYCIAHPEALIAKSYGPSYGFVTETETHTFYLRCTPVLKDYNAYVYCYLNPRKGR